MGRQRGAAGPDEDAGAEARSTPPISPISSAFSRRTTSGDRSSPTAIRSPPTGDRHVRRAQGPWQKKRDVVVRFVMAYLQGVKEFNAAARQPDKHPDIVEILARPPP